jgi:hypothetical protein
LLSSSINYLPVHKSDLLSEPLYLLSESYCVGGRVMFFRVPVLILWTVVLTTVVMNTFLIVCNVLYTAAI